MCDFKKHTTDVLKYKWQSKRDAVINEVLYMVFGLDTPGLFDVRGLSPVSRKDCLEKGIPLNRFLLWSVFFY